MTVHFLHRVDHLGPATAPDTLMRGYQFLGLGNLQGQVKRVENFRLGIRQSQPRHLIGDGAHLSRLTRLSGIGIVLQHLARVYDRGRRR